MTRRASQAETMPAATMRLGEPDEQCRIVLSIGPRNSASGMTVASVQPGKSSGVRVTA